MLKYFSDINEPLSSREMMFKDTKIWNEQGGQYVRDHCGQYPVIFITFNNCSRSTWGDMQSLLRELISDVYNQHRYIYDEEGFLSNSEKEEFNSILRKDPNGYFITAIMKLSQLLHRYHNKEVIILIDEYDKPVNHAYINGFAKEAIDFMSAAFTGALKDNPYDNDMASLSILTLDSSGTC